MTVTETQISDAKAEGLRSVDIAARICNELGVKFFHLCALLEKESNGRNVFGHDVGGTLSGYPKAVNQDNYEVFYWLVITKGGKSNGVGACQLTYKGFHTDMRTKGLKMWDPYDNITYGAKLWQSYYLNQREAGYEPWPAIQRAGTKYNTGQYGTSGYGERLLELAHKWRDIVGIDDHRT